MLLNPTPPVTNCYAFPDPLSPLERDVLYGQPLAPALSLLNFAHAQLVSSSAEITPPTSPPPLLMVVG